MNEKDYAKMMIEAQRAAFNALKGAAPIMNTVGGVPIAPMMDSRDTKEAIEKIGKMTRFEDVDYRMRNKNRLEIVEKTIPVKLRLAATYTPLVMREVGFWLCQEAARILKDSNVRDAMKMGRKLKDDVRDYDKIWQYEYDKGARESLTWLMKDWVEISLGDHLIKLKDSYKYIVNNGSGPKYKDQNAKDLIAWLFAICAMCDEIVRFDGEMIAKINKCIGSIGKRIEHKPRKDDFTYCIRDYAESVLNRFGYKAGWTCDGVEMGRKVLRTQMRLYDPESRLKEYERLLSLDDMV